MYVCVRVYKYQAIFNYKLKIFFVVILFKFRCKEILDIR